MKETKQEGTNMPMILGAVALVVLVGGIYVYAQNQGNMEQKPDIAMMEEADTNEMMQDDDAEEMMEDKIMNDDMEIVTVEGGMFYFKPDEIEVEKGQPVKITLKSVEGMHDFVIDELNIKTEVAKEGDTVEITFTPEKVGEFEFYCSVGNHRAQGMIGTIIVED